MDITTAVLRNIQTKQSGFLSGTVVGGLRSAAGVSAGQRAADVPPELQIDIESTDLKGMRELLRDPDVMSVTPTIPTKLIAPVGASAARVGGGNAWGIAAVGADQSAFVGANVTVAVLDTGIDAQHAAFAGAQIVSQDFTGNNNANDLQGHGTHCAGTILGRDVNSQRIGVAPGVPKLLAGKVLDDDGNGNSAMLFKGMWWAVQEGAQVVSMSLGFDFPGLVDSWVEEGWPVDLATSNALEAYRGNLLMFDAIMRMIRANEAFSRGTIVVAAAGNESRREVDPDYEIAASIPAAVEGVVSVGALAQGSNGLTIAPFSNTFPRISAPGVSILSAKAGGGLVEMNGTSMACPHVAGVAALWWQAVEESPQLATSQTVLAKLIATANTGGIDSTVDIKDRGVGLSTAP